LRRRRHFRRARGCAVRAVQSRGEPRHGALDAVGAAGADDDPRRRRAFPGPLLRRSDLRAARDVDHHVHAALDALSRNRAPGDRDLLPSRDLRNDSRPFLGAAMSEPLLSVRGLSKHFGGVHAVDGVDLDVQAHETVALIGPNGAGKTTFYNLLSGRMQPTGGSIVFDGRDVTGMAPHEISRLGISRSFQITNVFPELSARENVEVALTALHGKALRLFSRAAADRALHEEADALLARLGLGALASARAGTLSYGD